MAEHHTARLVVFALTYVAVAAPRLPWLRLTRPAAALVGAVAMIAVAGLPLAEAYRAVDLDVIAFLLGVLLLVAYLELAGAFEWAAREVVARAHGPRALLAAVVAISGLASALVMNDTVCVMLTPLVIAVLRPMQRRPAPYLLAVALAANVGSAMTITGNPQNMLIGLSSGIGYARFAAALAPASLGGLLVVYAVLALVYRTELAAPAASSVHVAPPAVGPPLDRALAVKCVVVLGAALAGWLAGYSLPLVALAAAAVLVLVARHDPAEAFARVDWPLLLFFAALFVVTRGVEGGPLVRGATDAAVARLHGAPGAAGAAHDATVVSAAMLALSNVVSNVPAVLLWRPVVPRLADPEFVWLVMAMSATFAGNLTLLGSMANLIVAERAAARGATLGFWEYLRVGVPVTLLTIALGVVTLLRLR